MPHLVLDVTGMHCGHCVTKVRDALQALEGVWVADVQLEAASADVDFDDGAASAEDMIRAVEGVGYGAEVRG